MSLDNYPTAGIDRARGEMYGEEPAPKHYAYDVGDAALTAMELDLARGWKNKPFWIMEQQPGRVNWGTINPGVRQGTVRLWTWHALAAGAETVVFFRWRAARFAQEQYHAGLLKHDGSPDVGFSDLMQMAGERELMEKIVAEPGRAQVAMIFNYDDLWALQLQPHRSGFTYLRLVFTWYRALLALGIPVDFRPLGAELSGYKMVLAPTLFLGSSDMAGVLCEYVSAGGTLVMGVRSGFKTPSNLVTDEPLPGVFRDLAGVAVREWHALPAGVGYALESEIPGLDGEAMVWAEALTPGPSGEDPTPGPSPQKRRGGEEVISDAAPQKRRIGEIEVMARYASGPFAGEAALTGHAIREGRMVYCGWQTTQRQAEAMIGHLATLCGVEQVGGLPSGVLAFRRGQFTVWLNFTEEDLPVQVGEKSVTLPSRQVWVEPV